MIMLIVINIKFREDSLNHFQVIALTRFLQTNRRPGGKQYICLPTLKGEDINIRILAQAGGGILLLQILWAMASQSKGGSI